MTKSEYGIGYQNGAPLESTVLEWTGGERPDWLRTRFIQNGPGLFSVGEERYKHWFDSLAMLRGFDIGDEIVARTAFLQSPDYLKSTGAAKISFTEFATVPERSWWQRVVASLPRNEFGKNASINFQPSGDGVLAIGDLPGGIEIEPATLQTIGPRDFRQRLMMITTPHPQHDHKRKESINVGVGVGLRGVGYNVFGVADGGMRARRIAFIPRPRPAYMHSVGTSESYVVVAEHPLLVSLSEMITLGIRNKPIIDAIDWEADEPMTMFVIDKSDGTVKATVETPAKLYFHHANVFEDNGEVVIDLCTYPDDGILDELYLDRLRTAGNETPPATLVRYRINLDGTSNGTVSSEPLCDASVEFPKVNPANLHRQYQYTYAVSFEPGTPTGQANQLVKVDVRTGGTKTWHEPGVYPTEPFMVPRPGAADEDDGVLLSVLLDANSKRSALALFDAKSMSEIGRAVIPAALPFGFHGQVLPLGGVGGSAA